MNKRLLFLFAIPALLLSQPTAQNVGKIIKDMADKCEAAKEYAFEGEIQMVGQKGSNPARVLSQAKVSIAISEPGKSYLRIEPQENNEYLLVSNGQKSWAFVPKLKQYTEFEGGEDLTGDTEDGSDSERDLVEKFARTIIPELARMYKTAENAGFAGEADVKYGGKKHKWPVIRVMSKRDKVEGMTMIEMTMDPATMSLGRMLWANVTYPQGEKLVIRMTADFSSFNVGSVPESTFNFEPPKNARLVEALPIPGQTGSFLLNHPAPDFELKNLEGERVRLSDLRGKPVMLSFWASWCGPCRRELPIVERVHAEMKGKGLVILGINNEGRGIAREFSRKAGLSFDTLDDGGRKVSRDYRVQSIPTTFLIDANGKIVRFMRGAKDESDLRAALKSIGL